MPASLRLIKKAIALKSLSEEQLNFSVRKILKAKYWMGLHTYKPVVLENLQEDLNTVSDALLHRKLVKNSITVLKDVRQNIPFANLENKKIAYVKLGDDSGDYFVNMLKNYKLKSPIIKDLNTLQSSISLETSKENLFFDLDFYRYENLSKKNSDRFEYILPKASLNLLLTPLEFEKSSIPPAFKKSGQSTKLVSIRFQDLFHIAHA